LIQTVDFFTPIVDDPGLFGEIAAANALSDVYAMGGRPISALNIVCFPSQALDLAVLREILAGGLRKLREARVALAGGHSVEDPELKYGLAVTGVVNPARVRTNRGAQDGDALILTKPLGTGIISTALKAELVEPATVSAAVAAMRTLNRAAAEAMEACAVHACTDVTGFGLIGHACEMIEESPLGIRISAADVPLLPQVQSLAEMGLLPAGLHRNRDFRAGSVTVADGVPLPLQDLLFDPQTSGGLLIAVPAGEASMLLERLGTAGVDAARHIGTVTSETPGRVRID